MANLLKPSGVNNIWAVTGTKTDPGAMKASTGWVVELPPYQTANWIEFRQDSFIAHSNQHGIPEWDAVTEYQGNISYTKGSNGLVYKCLITNINTDPANPLNASTWTQAFETYGSVAIVASDLSAHLSNYSTLAGIANTTAARINLSVYSKAESDGRFAELIGNASQTFSVATATLPQHAVPLGQFSSLLTQATEAQAGTAQIATNAEVAAGLIDTDIVTPLKAATVYLSKAGNLAGLGNTATARSNLGLGAIATMSDALFLKVSNNLSDVPNKVVARANLGLTSTATQPETYFLRSGSNLADLTNVVTARSSLGLTAMALQDPNAYMTKADSLTGIGNPAHARLQLQLGTAATSNNEAFLWRGNNLGDLPNVQAARNNLQLGNLATRNVYGVAGDLDFSSSGGDFGWMLRPDGILEVWGRVNITGQRDGSQTWPRVFNNGVWNIQLTNVEAYPNEGNTVRVTGFDRFGFSWSQNRADFTQYFFRAIGN